MRAAVVFQEGLAWGAANVAGWSIVAANVALQPVSNAVADSGVAFSPAAIWVVGGLLGSLATAFAFAGRQLLSAKDSTAAAITTSKDAVIQQQQLEIESLKAQLILSQEKEDRTQNRMIDLLQTEMRMAADGMRALAAESKETNAKHHAEHKMIIETNMVIQTGLRRLLDDNNTQSQSKEK